MDETSAAIEQISANENNKANDVVRGKQEHTTTTAVDIDNQTEKYDVSPENLEKSSCDITPNDDLSTSVTTTSATPNNDSLNGSIVDKQNDDSKSESKTKNTGFAFTIDFNEGRAVDNRKYKEIAERLQHRQQQQQEQRRHRRGVSLSKLDDSRKSSTSLNNMENGQILSSVDDSNVPITTAVATKPPFKQRQTKNTLDTDAKSDEKCDTKVVLRRPRPTAAPAANCKDSSKRHSWSPRSSLNYEKIPQMPHDQIPKDEPTTKCIENSTAAFQPKSTILQRALDTNSLRPMSKGSAKLKPTPIGSGKKVIRDHVVTAPLEYVRNSDDEGSIGDASQATYTLDGDNYTEEEKERMSIDKLGKRNFDLSIESRSKNDLNRNFTPALKNALQTNFSRDIKIEPKISQRNSIERDNLAKSSPKTTKSYLDKIKTRVKTIGDRTFHKTQIKSPTTNEKLMNLQVVRTDDSSPVESDHGVFTSITACGVLNKQNQEANSYPTATITNKQRKQSLTKFQIDSSEYIQPQVDESLMSSYTDYEKAKHHEYKLKIFSTVSSYTSSGTSPIQTDDDNLSVECVDDKPISIKTAPTKNDWIQEWAKNARRRNNLLASSATASPKMQHYPKTGSGRSKVTQLQGNDDRMSQSYDTYFNHVEQQFGDDVIGDSSDECTAAHTSRAIGRNASNAKTEYQNNADPKTTTTTNTMLRPPISPTKIPSPMHSQLRARSSSANRSFRNSNAVSFFSFYYVIFGYFFIFGTSKLEE